MMYEKDYLNKEIQYSDKYGSIILLNTDSNDGIIRQQTKCTIKFINTGFINTVTYDTIKKNRLRDGLSPEICGIACCGYAKNKDNPMEYKIWARMIHKCYDQNNPYYKSFGALGFTVCKRWLRFDYFLEDYFKYEKPECSSDIQIQFVIKPELLELGCKEFSFENCCLKANEVDIKFGSVYNSNSYGSFTAIKYVKDANNNKKVLIKFTATGFEDLVEPRRVLDGSVMDPYYPHICGVGYLGSGTTKGQTREHGIWARMINRCYNPNDKSYQFYGGAGVKVCERWFNFTNFAEDIKMLPNYDKWLLNDEPYELDKDYLQQGVPKKYMVYSPSTCVFLHSADNVAMASENIHNYSNRNFIGVATNSANNYVATLQGKYIGTYNNADAAANARDTWAKWNGVALENTNKVYMPVEEWVKYRVDAKQMYDIVGPMKDPWE